MIKSANEKKVQSQDLSKADDEIRSSIVWIDPIDSLTTFCHGYTNDGLRQRMDDGGKSVELRNWEWHKSMKTKIKIKEPRWGETRIQD